MTVEVPKDWVPLLEWHDRWHYKQQYQFVGDIKDNWEVLFVAGNGTGKSHIFYWTIITLAYGIHPSQFAPPPLKIKILLHDFEHGYGKIFRETCMENQPMPERYEVWDDERDDFRVWFAEEDRAEDWIKKDGGSNFRIKHYEQSTLGPMLAASMVQREPSKDDRTLYLANGSYIFFQTSEQKKRQHSGTNFDLLGCDEEPEKQVYDESKRGLRTARGEGRILHAFTPPFDEETKNKGPTWTKFDIIDPWEKGKLPDVSVIRASVYDNPAITNKFIERFSKGKTEATLRIQLYGDYPTWGKLIFPEFEDFLWDPAKKMGNLLPSDFEVPWDDPDVLFEMAVDWHGSKAPAIVWSFEYLTGPNVGDVIVFDELSPEAGKGLTIMDTVQACREIEGWSRRKIIRYGDPKMKDKNNALISGFSPWDEFRNNGMRLYPGWNREPYVGYMVIRDFLRGKGKTNPNHPRLFIMENCVTLRHNIKNHYNVSKNDGTADPDPVFSDYCVSLKYIMVKKSRKQRKSLEKRQKRLPIQSLLADPTYSPYVDRRLLRGEHHS